MKNRRMHHAGPRAAAPSAANPQEHGVERVFGRHSVRALLLTRPKAVRGLLIDETQAHNEGLIARAKETGIAVQMLSRPDFLAAGAFRREEIHQGILALAEPRRIYTEQDFGELETARTVLALDQISNPPNLAAMVRSAAFFGVDAILLPRDRSVNVSAEVVRYAVGGAEFVKFFRVTNLSQSLEALKDFGFEVVGLDERGDRTLAQANFAEKLVLVVGAEGDGLRPKTKKYCDRLVRIPGGREGIESLNAGVATSIALAEVFRGRS